MGFRDAVGAVWHAWSDRFVRGDEAQQINMGLVQCDDPQSGFQAGRRWSSVDALIAEKNRTIMRRIQRKTGF